MKLSAAQEQLQGRLCRLLHLGENPEPDTGRSLGLDAALVQVLPAGMEE